MFKIVKKQVLLLALVLIFGAFMRFFLITEIPPGLYPDEAMNGNNALEAIETGQFKIFYPENNGREGFFINLQAISIWAFGNETWALRLVSAIFGTLTILGLYLFTKELFYENPKSEIRNSKQILNPNNQNIKLFSFWNFKNWNLFRIWDLGFGISRREQIALLSSFLLATSYWHINFSRIGFRAIMVPFFLVFGFYWLLKALRTGKISSTVLAGIFIGLGFHTYIAFRLAPLILVVPLGWYLWQRWIRNKELGIRNNDYSGAVHDSSFIIPDSKGCVTCVIALFLFVTFVTALPIGYYFLTHPEDFGGRQTQVSIFSAENPTKELTVSAVKTLGMFNFRGDCNQRHNFLCKPELNWVVGIFFIIGLFVSIRKLFAKNSKSDPPAGGLNPRQPQNSNYLKSKPFGIFNFKNWNLFRVSNLFARRSLNEDGEFRISKEKFPYLLLVIWFFVMMFPAILTREGLPHALRSIGMIPPVMIFGAVGFLAAVNAALKKAVDLSEAGLLTEKSYKRLKIEFAIVMLLIILYISADVFNKYIIKFSGHKQTYFAFSVDLFRIGKFLDGTDNNVTKYVIVNMNGVDLRGVPMPAATLMFLSDSFTESKKLERNIRYILSPDLDNLKPEGKFMIIPLNPLEEELMDRIKNKFPDLKFKIPAEFYVITNTDI